MTIEDVLVERGLVGAEALERARREAAATRSPLRQVLVRDGLVTEEQIGWHVATSQGLPFVHLTADMVDGDLARRAGAEFLRARGALPLQPLCGEVAVVVADPDAAGPVEDLRSALGGTLVVNLAVAQESRIREIQDRLFGTSDATGACGDGLDDPTGVAAFHGHLVRAALGRAEELRFDPTPLGLAVRVRAGTEVRTVGRLSERCAYGVAARARLLLEGATTGTLYTALAGRPLRLDLEIVPARHAEAVVVAIRRTAGRDRAPLEALLPRDAVARAVELALAGPVVLVAGPDARTRRDVARGLAHACGAAAAPVVVVEAEEPFDDLDAVSLPPEQLGRAAALRPRLLVVDVPGPDGVALRELAAAVPSMVLARGERTAAAALALCPDSLRPLVRAAVSPGSVVEARQWS